MATVTSDTPDNADGDDISVPDVGKETGGYRALADLMGTFPHTGMYKRFASLNARLLIQQAEILHLETELRDLITDDRQAGFSYDENAQVLIASAQKDGIQAEQWRLTLEIRHKLKEYSVSLFYDGRNSLRANDCTDAALLQQVEMRRLPQPRPYDLNMLRKWLMDEQGGNNFLGSDEDRPWLEGEERDLAAVDVSDLDILTRWIEERVLPWAYTSGILRKVRESEQFAKIRVTDGMQTPVPGYEVINIVEWRDSLFQKTSRILAVIMSTLLPALAIAMLYLSDSLRVQVLTASLLMALFSTAMAVTTTCRPAELFTATAA